MSVLDTVLSDGKKVAGFIEPAFAFIAVAQTATGLGGKSAEVAIKVIDAALKSLAGLADGSVTREQALASMDALHKGLLSDDAAADAALADKFRR